MRTLLLLLVLATPAWAQQAIEIVTVPVNFQNDLREPRTLAQLKADADVYAALVYGPQNTHGLVTTTTVVRNYVTISMDRGCNGAGATLPALNMATFYQKLDAALAQRGDPPRTAYTWVVSPTTFVACSHTTRYKEAWDYGLNAEEAGNWAAWYGLGLPLSVNWKCVLNGAIVTLGGACGPATTSSTGGRDLTSITGQGGRSLLPFDRVSKGWLTAAEQLTVTMSNWQGTLVRIESTAPGVKRLLIPAMGIEVAYLGQQGLFGWDYRGITGFVMNSSKRIDFTPDDCWLFCTTALAPGAPPFVYNGLQLSVLSIDATSVVVSLQPASGGPSMPPTPVVTVTLTTPPTPIVTVTPQ